MRALVASLLLISAAPALAVAAETIPTAPANAQVPVAAPAPPLADAPDEDAGADPVVRRAGPCGPQAVKPDGEVETKAHGYVEGGIGAGGYRHVGAGFCKPFKNGGAVAVSVSETRFDDRRVQGR